MNKIESGQTVVIGAGPAGLAFAARYIENGGQCAVFEASNDIGGLARSFPLWGGIVDCGPHRFFSSDPEVNKFWFKHVAGKYSIISRQTRIFYDGKFYDYPLKAHNALTNLGLSKALLAVASYIKVRILPPIDDGSLESWVTRKFGKFLHQTFFKFYTEKVWGIECKEIDADWAAQRIQGLTLWKAIKGALLNNRDNNIKTLVDEFAYPSPSNQIFYDNLVSFIQESGGEVRINSAVKRIEVKDGQVLGVELRDGNFIEAKSVISSMPITSLLNGLHDVPEEVKIAASQLRFRNTILVYLRVDVAQIFPDQWLYIHDPNLAHGRVTNFNNWSDKMRPLDNSSILCLEFWCFDEDSIWLADDEVIVQQAKEEISKTGLVNPEKVSDSYVLKVKRSYPVYQRGYRDHLKKVTAYLDGIQGLVLIGRYGSFKYNNQDHSILMGLVAADALSSGTKPNLWDINTDSTYQESASSQILSPRKSQS